MIRLKQLLFEMTDAEFKSITNKIQLGNFRYIGAGDNGRVYQINGEDKVFKITTSKDEIEVARQIANKIADYSTFIPVYYVGDLKGLDTDYKDAFIMANAENLIPSTKRKIDRVVNKFKEYAYDQGGEVSLFDFIDNADITQFDPAILNFIEALQADVEKLNIPEFDLDLDFKSDNIMIWNGKMVMVDW